MRTIDISYFFRSFPLAQAAALPVGVKPATMEQRAALAANPDCFDRAKTDFTDASKASHTLEAACRKPVEASINVPDLADIPSDSKLLQAIIEERVRTYVKAAYVDKYAPIGVHDWATIEQSWLASQEASGGFTACPYTDEQFTTAQAIFTAYLDKVAPKLGAACVKLITNRAAKRQVQSALSKFGYSEKTLGKLLERVIECASNLQDTDVNASVLAYCAERINALIEAEKTASVNDDDM